MDEIGGEWKGLKRRRGEDSGNNVRKDGRVKIKRKGMRKDKRGGGRRRK